MDAFAEFPECAPARACGTLPCKLVNVCKSDTLSGFYVFLNYSYVDEDWIERPWP